VVRGSRSFGLKSVARAMHGHGLVATGWGDGLADGTGAMVGAWTADAAARRSATRIADVPLMAEVSRYNEIDCRVMAEVLDHLRREH
jgi:predicted RecB family nuclease